MASKKSELRTLMAKAFLKISAALALVSVPSFIVFVAFSLLVGGDALNGFAVEGRYYVSSHGNDTEVSWLTYTISWYLGALTIVTFIPMVICGAISQALEKRAKDEF